MKRGLWLWRLAVVLATSGIVLGVARPAWAVIGVGDVRFTISDVLVLMAVAVAWGDMRRVVSQVQADVAELKGRGVRSPQRERRKKTGR